MASKFNACTAAVKETGDQDTLDLCARHLYEMTAETVMCHLLLHNAVQAPELFGKSLNVYVNMAEADVARHATLLEHLDVEQLENYRRE
jgi:hypothetical protein